MEYLLPRIVGALKIAAQSSDHGFPTYPIGGYAGSWNPSQSNIAESTEICTEGVIGLGLVAVVYV